MLNPGFLFKYSIFTFFGAIDMIDSLGIPRDPLGMLPSASLHIRFKGGVLCLILLLKILFCYFRCRSSNVITYKTRDGPGPQPLGPSQSQKRQAYKMSEPRMFLRTGKTNVSAYIAPPLKGICSQGVLVGNN